MLYLCPVCGTLFDNLKLFPHVQEVHNRFICLFCREMFFQADSLAEHLMTNHGVKERSYDPPDHSLGLFDSCDVICCTCNQTFSGRENFFEHECHETETSTNPEVNETYFPYHQQTITPEVHGFQSIRLSEKPAMTHTSQLTHLVPVYNFAQRRNAGQPTTFFFGENRQNKLSVSSNLNGDSAIYDASQYCCVNIHEYPETQKLGNSKLHTEDRNIHTKEIFTKEALLHVKKQKGMDHFGNNKCMTTKSKRKTQKGTENTLQENTEFQSFKVTQKLINNMGRKNESETVIYENKNYNYLSSTKKEKSQQDTDNTCEEDTGTEFQSSKDTQKLNNNDMECKNDSEAVINDNNSSSTKKDTSIIGQGDTKLQSSVTQRLKYNMEHKNKPEIVIDKHKYNEDSKLTSNTTTEQSQSNTSNTNQEDANSGNTEHEHESKMLIYESTNDNHTSRTNKDNDNTFQEDTEFQCSKAMEIINNNMEFNNESEAVIKESTKYNDTSNTDKEQTREVTDNTCQEEFHNLMVKQELYGNAGHKCESETLNNVDKSYEEEKYTKIIHCLNQEEMDKDNPDQHNSSKSTVKRKLKHKLYTLNDMSICPIQNPDPHLTEVVNTPSVCQESFTGTLTHCNVQADSKGARKQIHKRERVPKTLGINVKEVYSDQLSERKEWHISNKPLGPLSLNSSKESTTSTNEYKVNTENISECAARLDLLDQRGINPEEVSNSSGTSTAEAEICSESKTFSINVKKNYPKTSSEAYISVSTKTESPNDIGCESESSDSCGRNQCIINSCGLSTLSENNSQQQEEKMKPINQNSAMTEELTVDYSESGKMATTKDEENCIYIKEPCAIEPEGNIQLAGDEVPVLMISLKDKGMLSIQTLVKECIKISSSTCEYCNHANKITVNGKQLVLHLLAKHRFEPFVYFYHAELTSPEGFVEKLKTSLPALQDMYLETNHYGNLTKKLTRSYECFQCSFSTPLYKAFCGHNRKLHKKTFLQCIMCTCDFYSYSELLCHLCPGCKIQDSNVKFRCCLCAVTNLPSAFRLMVHLRKSHNTCDACLETAVNQRSLSKHIVRHKLNHPCYHCGIAYRNKSNIANHLFWKHDTESVRCNKCLQKRWPYVYHFCMPPKVFVCNECNDSFSRAVALRVHERVHRGILPHACEACKVQFISRKLLQKHQETHKQASEDTQSILNEGLAKFVNSRDDISIIHEDTFKTSGEELGCMDNIQKVTGSLPTEVIQNSDERHKKTKVVDIFDLPPLNLSCSSDESDDGEVGQAVSAPKKLCTEQCIDSHATVEATEEVQPIQAAKDIWDNFMAYKAHLEKQERLQAHSSILQTPSSLFYNPGHSKFSDSILKDHDYCIIGTKPNNGGSSQPDIEESKRPQQNSETPHSGENRAFNVQCDNVCNEAPPNDGKDERESVTSSSSSSSGTTCSGGSKCSRNSSSVPGSSDCESEVGQEQRKNEGGISPNQEFAYNEVPHQENHMTKCKIELLGQGHKKKRVKSGKISPKQEYETFQISQPGNYTIKQDEQETDLPVRESDMETSDPETDEDFYDVCTQNQAIRLVTEGRYQWNPSATMPKAIDNPCLNEIKEEMDKDNPDQHNSSKSTVKRKLKHKLYTLNDTSISPIQNPDSHLTEVVNTPSVCQESFTGTLTHCNVQADSKGARKRIHKRERLPKTLGINVKEVYSDQLSERTEWHISNKPLGPLSLKSSRNSAGTPNVITIPLGLPEQKIKAIDQEARTSSVDLNGLGKQDEEFINMCCDTTLPAETNGNIKKASHEGKETLYCYCQCPYDEVSEMIGCDGKDCAIEWFHFECVGVTEAPNGRWLCPSCQKYED